MIVRPRASGGTEEIVRPEETRQYVLSDRQLRILARLGSAIAAHFGHPQDVEWAFAGDEPFIVQARPITALPGREPRPTKSQRLKARMAVELLPERPFPLELATWVPAVYGSIVRFVSLLGLEAVPIERLSEVDDGVVTRLGDEPPLHLTARVLSAPFRLLSAAHRYDPANWKADPLLTEALNRAKVLEALDLQKRSWDELRGTARDALVIPSLVWRLRDRYQIRSMMALGRLRLALAFLGHSDYFASLAFTGVETKTIESNRLLEAFAERVRMSPRLSDAFSRLDTDSLWSALEHDSEGRSFLEDLNKYLSEYGHREAGGTLQISKPTWRDAPEVVLDVVKGLARAQARRSDSSSEWELVLTKVLKHPLLQLHPVRTAFIRLLRTARYTAQIREDTHFYFMLPVPVLRRTFMELGTRLVRAGILSKASEVFHLKFDELGWMGWVDPAFAPGPEAAEIKRTVLTRAARRAKIEATPLVDPRLFGLSRE